MNRLLLLSGLLCLLLGCQDPFQKELEQLQLTHSTRQTKYQQMRDQYATNLTEYQNLRQAHDAAAAQQGEDSLHQVINARHDEIAAAHPIYFERHDEILAQHEGLLQRLSVEGYGEENIRKDFHTMMQDYDKLEQEFSYINADLNQMIEEQNGMLAEY